MKQRLASILGALTIVLGMTGCLNHQCTPLPERDLIAVTPLNMDNLPLHWFQRFSTDVKKPPVINPAYGMHFPFDLEVPKNSVYFGSTYNSIVFVNPSEVYSNFFTQDNLTGADLKFWRDLLYRKMTEVHQFNKIEEDDFVTREAIDGFALTGIKQEKGISYKYRIVCVLFDDVLYFAELYGHTAQFDQALKDFDYVVQNWELSIWRMNRDRSETYTFFSYGPVVVNVPDEKSGVFKPNWSILQLGFSPYVQSFNSQTNIYGLHLAVWSSQQAATYGISCNLFSAAKDHRGIQFGLVATAAEKNYGLAWSALYSAAQCNNGLLLSLFTRSEKGSNGVQIGLLNFSSDPRYLSWCPLISFPIFSAEEK